MIDDNAATLALRNRMLALVVCTTGAVTLSATATGYARTAGSFLTDGFEDGMELLAAGFGTAGNNGYRVIENVSALEIITTTAVAQPTVEAAAAARTLMVGVPEDVAIENARLTPRAGRPFVEEDYVPGGHRMTGYPANGSSNDEDGLYVIKWYGLEGYGTNAIRKCVNALKALYAPGTTFTLAGGVALRARGGPGEEGVSSSQILPQGNGWSVCAVTVPWRAFSQNTVTA